MIKARSYITDLYSNGSGRSYDQNVKLEESSFQSGRAATDTCKDPVKQNDIFLRTVVHQLKQPLTEMISLAELLRLCHPTMPPDELEQSLQRLVKRGHKLGQMLEDFFLLASLPHAEVEMEPLCMSCIFTEAQQRLARMIEDHQARIILPSAWPTAIGYAPWVEEVWVNYLSNGLKYGGQPPHLKLGATSQSNGMIRFWVCDNGSGLTPEEQSRLFKPFTRLHPERAEGQGLGLSIVQSIVHKLRGQVGVASEGIPGQGTIFWFTLPTGEGKSIR